MSTPSIPSEKDEEKGRIDTASNAKNADATIADGAGDGAQQYTDSSERAENSPEATTSTQEDMGDGSGIRGDYGDSSQTNGKEG